MFQSLSEYRCESDCDTSVDIRQNALYYSGHSYFRLSGDTPRRAEWVCWIAENSATRPMLIKRSTTTTAAAGEGKIYYTAYRYIVTTSRNDSCMGSGESHFNVSLIVRDKVTSVH